MPPFSGRGSGTRRRATKKLRKQAQAKSEQYYVMRVVRWVLGCCRHALSITPVSPLSSASMLLQLQDAATPETCRDAPRYVGIAECIRDVVAKCGMYALFRGNTANIVRYALTSSHVFDGVMPAFTREDFWRWFWSRALSQSLSSIASAGIVYPLDLVRTRLTMDVGQGTNHEFAGVSECISSIARRGGLLALYRGFGVMAVGAVAYRCTYDLIEIVALRILQPRGSVMNFLFHQCIGIVAGLARYPFDTVTRRLMMDAGASAAPAPYRTPFHCFHRILAEEGAGAFFKGCLADIGREVGVVACVCWVGMLRVRGGGGVACAEGWGCCMFGGMGVLRVRGGGGIAG